MNATITVSHTAFIFDWAATVKATMPKSTTHKSSSGLIYTVYSVQCPDSWFSFFSLSHSNPPSLPLICLVFSTTLPKHTLITDLCSWYSHPLTRKKRVGASSPLIQAAFIYVISMASTVKPSFVSLQGNLLTQWKEIRMFVSLPGSEAEALGDRKNNPPPKNLCLFLTSCSRHLRYEREMWLIPLPGGYFLVCYDNYEWISLSKHQSVCFFIRWIMMRQITLCSNFCH